ncbi:PelD GGDEF domain-containing protein [Paraburkholderia sartisoli]|uniref:GAF domain-containing protein n=1 Tax=Paraburkholderia sartisoli TaxID=83784 RepID=A0A1H4ELX2_9BURK|nr:PelD GGDEF domain-containing protein [Paraburkholderia sartisoli]SEA86035.1 GAF domain-containing protein [Paraburkholderia sartisoli]
MNTAAVQSAPGASKPRNANPFGNLGRVRRFLAPAVARPFAIVESIVFMAVVCGVAWWVDPHDPLLLGAGFPWLWLAALVVALRYGTLLGLLAGALLVLDWALFYPHGGAFPVMFFAGGLIETIITGHFGDTWGSRTRRASALNDYLNDRLVALTNSHYLLRLSHERLEKDLLSKPTTLRDSITELRRLSVAHGAEASAPVHAHDEALPGAHGLLEFVAQACQVEVAALYPVHGGRPSTEAVARIGDTFDFDPKDELVTHAIGTLAIAHLKHEETPVTNTHYVVCAPLVSADGELIALLVVKRMPFLSLNFDNLQLLLVLLGYYADGVEHSAFVQRILDTVPGCPYDFALDLGRLTRLQRDAGVESSLVALVFPHDEAGDSLFEHVMRRRRALDVMWPLRTAKQSVLVNLMPATDTTGVDGYLARTEGSLAAQFNTDLEAARVGVHTLHLDGAEPGTALRRLLQRSGLDV